MRHPLSDTSPALAVARWGDARVQEKRQSAFVRDGIPENAIVVYSMTLNPEDYDEARCAFASEIEQMIYRTRFASVKLFKDVMVPRGVARLASARGDIGYVRFR